MIGSSIQPVQQLLTWSVISAYMYGAGTSLEGKMANFPLICSLFRINVVLKIEIEQLEEKLDLIKEMAWLNLSAETLTNNYNVKIACKEAQIVGTSPQMGGWYLPYFFLIQNIKLSKDGPSMEYIWNVFFLWIKITVLLGSNLFFKPLINAKIEFLSHFVGSGSPTFLL